MPHYNLTNGAETLCESAGSRVQALYLFEQKIGKELTLEDQGTVADHLMDEWTESPHWVYPTIPVWVVENA